MNRLSTERRGRVISCLVEGMSMRAGGRVAGVARNTVDKLLGDLGEACSEYQDRTLRNLTCDRFECDEIWSFCYSKQKIVPIKHESEFGYGDVWTWTAIDAETKLVPSWLVGRRDNRDCYTFLADLRSRLRPGRIQLTTDGLAYLAVIEPLFGADRVDYAQLIKLYAGGQTEHRYPPAACTGIDQRIVTRTPDPQLVSTSCVERQNLTMRMSVRRFTRLTNAFSKKVENHAAAVSLHFMYYNFARPHQTLTKRFGRKTTPAMAAGVADRVWSDWEIASLLDPK
ncbi:MAG: IS1 family transposase [Acidimicrobiales bacterium]